MPAGICKRIADSKALTALSDAIPELVSPDASSHARAAVGGAISELKHLDRIAPPAMHTAIQHVEAALNSFGMKSPDDTAVTNAAAALDELGTEVRNECGTPPK
jgi:hypothetical protein